VQAAQLNRLQELHQKGRRQGVGPRPAPVFIALNPS
jgi:hypothetical protein